MEIRKTTACETDALISLFDEARGTIAALGIDQWQNGYPSRDVIVDDIEIGRSYVVQLEDAIIGTFVLVDDGEPTYDVIYDGHWLSGDDRRDYLAIHRVAVSVARRGSGVSSAIVSYAEACARRWGYMSLRIDTHEGNVVMRRMLEKHGFSYCGRIRLADGAWRVAYEKVIDA